MKKGKAKSAIPPTNKRGNGYKQGFYDGYKRGFNIALSTIPREEIKEY